MPTTLAPVNLAGLAVQATGSIDLTPAAGQGGVSWGLPGQQKPTLRLHNESGTGLLCSFPTSGQSFYLTAGGWQDCFPRAGDNALNFTVQYVLPNPPVTQLFATYYGPGEPVPPITTLGNSPIGIGGTVNVSNIQTLTNDGNTPGTLIIESTPDGDGVSAVSVLNTGVETLGSTDRNGELDLVNTGGQKLSLTATGIGIAGGNPNAFLDLRSNQSKLFGFSNAAGNGVGLGGNGTVDAEVDTNGLTMLAGGITLAQGSSPQKMTGWAWGNGTTGATGSVVITHGLGVVPSAIILNGYNSINNSWGVDTITTTQFTAHVSSGNAKTFAWLALI